MRTSYEIRHVHIPSRFFLAPINTGFCIDGVPKEGLRLFHSQRSGKHIGISYVGNVAIHPEWALSASTGDFRQPFAWKAIADAITTSGSVAGIQIAAKVTKRRSAAKWRNPHVAQDLQSDRDAICALDLGTLRMIIRQFVDAAIIAYEKGFAVVQIHAAHGYFLSQLLCPTINQRTDCYGQSHTLALREIIEGIREANDQIIKDVRLSLRDGIASPEIEWEHTQHIIDELMTTDVDIISLSNGIYDNDRFDIYPPAERGHLCYLGDATRLAAMHPNILWNVAGNTWDLQAGAELLRSNVSLSIGRALIANPEFVQQSVEGSESIGRCCRFGHCHYYSRNQPHITCGVNPQVGGVDGLFADLRDG